MALVIDGLTVRLRDPETGEMKTSELTAGVAWPCITESQRSPAPASSAAKPAPTPPERKPPRKKVKAQAKAKTSVKKAKAKANANAVPEAPAKPRLDLRDPLNETAFDEAIYTQLAQSGRPVATKTLQKKIEVDEFQVVAALARLVDKGRIVQRGKGEQARYTLPTNAAPTAAPEPELVPEVVRPRAAALSWVSDVIKDRETLAAVWEDGAFRIVQRSTGVYALYYETGESTVYDYGCGALLLLKDLAQKLAAMGLPSPQAYRAAGGDLNRCPSPKRMRLGDAELTWRESVDGDRQICVAAAGQGEFKMLKNDNGSFILAFAREGDRDFQNLGCGTREALESRALDILGQTLADADDDAAAADVEPAVAPAPSAPAAPPSGVDPQKDKTIMNAMKQLLAEVP
jgi:hypothetical protein